MCRREGDLRGGTPEPKSKAAPFVWRWRDARPQAMRAAELVGTESAVRRVLLLEAGPDSPRFDHLPDEIKFGFETGTSMPPLRTPAGHPIHYFFCHRQAQHPLHASWHLREHNTSP